MPMVHSVPGDSWWTARRPQATGPMETPRQPPGLAMLNTLTRARHYILWGTDAFTMCSFDHAANSEVVCNSAGNKSECHLLVVTVHVGVIQYLGSPSHCPLRSLHLHNNARESTTITAKIYK